MTPQRRAGRVALALAIAGLPALALAQAAPAGAIAFPQNAFGVAPTARFVNAAPPASLGPLLVANTTQRIYGVRVRPVLIEQRRDGAFQPRLTRPALRAAADLLALSASRFTLLPGRQQWVDVRWARAPRASRSAALAVMVEGRPAAGSATASQVGARAVILSLDIVQLPGTLDVRGGLVSLRAEQGARRGIRLLSRIRNTGRELGVARAGTVLVRDAAGRAVFRRSWGGQALDLVVAGATVDFPVTIGRRLRAGLYTARTSVSFGGHRSVRTTSFRLVGPGRLPTVRLQIAAFDATGRPGGPARVRMTVDNVGTATAGVQARATLVRLTATGERRVAQARLRAGRVRPGASAVLAASLGTLGAGRYRVDVALAGGGGDDQVRTTAVLARRSASALDHARRFLTDHATDLLAIAALLVIGTLSVALVRTRRRLRTAGAPAALDL